jgi:hypothetical protein
MDNYEHSQICQSFSEILTSGKLGFAKNTNLQFLEQYSAFIIMTSSKIIDIQLNYIMKNDMKVFSMLNIMVTLGKIWDQWFESENNFL